MADEQTSPEAASAASRVLSDPKSSPDAKRAAGSALTQVANAGGGGVVGLDVFFAAKDVVIERDDGTLASKIEGVDPETLLFHGVHPETKERVTVTIEALKTQFGDKIGEKKYLQIAGINQGSVFFNPKAEATTYRPPLGIAGLTDPKLQQRVADILAKE